MTNKISPAMTDEKIHGRIYTPSYLVNNILDLCQYSGDQIVQKHIIDNSCGDGAFLIQIVKRYCTVAQSLGMTNEQIRADLSTYIHGIELDENECKMCIENLNKLAGLFGVHGVEWDILAGNTLLIKRFNGKMDYVVGNPPYVRVHNLNENYHEVKNFSFAKNGMTDLFIVFYEIGLEMLNEQGVLGYISPSSFFNSIAGSTMRAYLTQNFCIRAIVDLMHFQPFSASTYTTIAVLSKQHEKKLDYYRYDAKKLQPVFISSLEYEDFYVNGIFVFGEQAEIDSMRQIMSFENGLPYCVVKNGFATLFDNFFIGDLEFDDFTIPIIKASTGKWSKCFFPYDADGQLLPFVELIAIPEIKRHYELHEARLKSRNIEKASSWYGFGRSQGIGDVPYRKYAINSLLRDFNDIKLSVCEEGSGVYSGLYILTEASINELEEILYTFEFVKYISQLHKYKSGGYYTFSSKDLQRYLNYKFSERRGFTGGQLSFFGNT